MILQAIGAYVSQSPLTYASFCASHFLRSKAMEEVVKLMSQLTSLCKTLFDLPQLNTSALLPPDITNQTLLRQVLLSGYGDCVAKLDETTTGKIDIPTYQIPWSLPTEQFVIHSSSALYRIRPAPKWIVFDCVQGRMETIGADGKLLDFRMGSGQLSRKFLKGVTVVRDCWLDCDLLNEGRLLDQPEPRYSGKTDSVQGFISPTYGSKMWPLGLRERTVEGREGVGWFGKAVLEGSVFGGVFGMLVVRD